MWNLFAFFQTFFDIVVNTALRMTVGKIGGFFEKKIKFCKLFQSWVKTSNFRLKRYITVREQLPISSRDPTFEVENFDWDPPFQRFLSRFWVFFTNFCQNVSRAVVKTAFCVSRRKFWLIFCKICGFFSKYEQTLIEVLIVKFHHCSQNKIQHVQRNNWRKKLPLLF